MGGVSNEWTGLPSNALLLCRSCHRWVEQHRDAALSAGWLVHYGTDPATVPVRVVGGQLVLLSAAGDYVRAVGKLGVEVSGRCVPTMW